MKYLELDTPSLLIDQEIMMSNLRKMQDYADHQNVALRPHTKTHKMPEIAKLQLELGSQGIAVAKIGEAEVMAENGITDIMIANEVVGEQKLKRIARLAENIQVAFGVDSIFQINQAEEVFAQTNQIAEIMIEVEVGEVRCGVDNDKDLYPLLDEISKCKHVHLIGLFGHDGNTYNVKDMDECEKISFGAQGKLIHFAELTRKYGMDISVVSYGSTPPLVHGVKILDGITEIRPGTYAFMDASQGNAQGDLSMCAATVLASIISRPTSERVILDVGAKGLTMQERTVGICNSHGKGFIKNYPGIAINRMFDEHSIINSTAFHDQVNVGEKVQIIPVHICPTCNLYNKAYLISGDDVVKELDIAARGKVQ